MFYLFNQNNSGGSFIVNDKVCHRLFIEADDGREALRVAESLGCYWDGVSKGLDCPCCGDRWSRYCNEIDINKFKKDGYEVSVYDSIYHNTVQEWEKKYGKFTIVKQPHFKSDKYGNFRSYVGSISFASIEEYAQYMANTNGWTTPDARIFYKDGHIKEIMVNR